jgi:hypothetical protein
MTFEKFVHRYLLYMRAHMGVSMVVSWLGLITCNSLFAALICLASLVCCLYWFGWAWSENRELEANLPVTRRRRGDQ